ncbi:hypothetical protein [Gulosibacter faecalis]|uniref:Uncharacterized protein n=1 Tax=Gulosibacter faecalis TaxID=272240 RepID=A0ABW5UW12_9MICO|nr:hypothetical protein [Gulosibacter faecalis]
MSKEFQLSGRLPNSERNGLEAHARAFLDVDAPAPSIVIARIERKSRKVDDDTGDVSALAKITHIEVVEEPEELNHIEELLSALANARSGDEPLPMVVEREADLESPTDGFAELDETFGGDL